MPADVQPAAAHLTEDFYRAGGLDAVLGQIAEHLEAGLTVSGCRLTDQISGELPRDARMSGTAFGTVVLHVAPSPLRAARSRWCAPAT